MSDSNNSGLSAGIALLLIPIVAVAAIIGLVVMFVVVINSDSANGADCNLGGSAVTVSGTLPSQVGDYSGDQLTNAAAIITIGAQRSLSARAQQIALIAAMTESSLHNDSGGDRDSAGLFQMRPSQGWGTYQQVTDISFAINEFYDRLVQVANWQTMDPGDVAQAIERSAYPARYATHVAQAVQIMNALSGVTATVVSATDDGLVCGSGVGNTDITLPAGAVGPTGPHAAVIAQVIAYAEAQLGKPYVLGGAGPDVWDCSGLTMKAYASVGIDIGPHDSTAQWRKGVASGQMHPLSQVQAGDLIFWGGNDAYHVGISLGGNWMIAAPQPGENVKIQTVWGTPNSEVWRPVDGLPSDES
ncbi:C40 family peptidase [Leifsonia shinshuensis]